MQGDWHHTLPLPQVHRFLSNLKPPQSYLCETSKTNPLIFQTYIKKPAMYVIKRDGSKVHASFDQISERIRSLCQEQGLATMEVEGDGGLINVELLGKEMRP